MSRNDHNYRACIKRPYLDRFHDAWKVAENSPLQKKIDLVKLYVDTAVSVNDTHLLGAIFNAFPTGENRNKAVRYLCQQILARGTAVHGDVVHVTRVLLRKPFMCIDPRVQEDFSGQLLRLSQFHNRRERPGYPRRQYPRPGR